MKVDLVVNTMIQQIDRNLQSQMMPAMNWRAGDILRGKVMLRSDEGLQIRLDGGALLNAVPAGDVLLSPGATVTLRVGSHADNELVMQLLTQDNGAAAQAQPGVGGMLARLGADPSPQARQVAQAMERMGLPLLEETAREALATLAQFTGLAPEKAVFLAANRIHATQANVDALNRLVDGKAALGADLLRLADILSTQALQADAPVGADESSHTAPQAADMPEGWEGETPPASPAAPGPAGPAVAAGGAARGAAAFSGEDARLNLQSLIHVALGADAVAQSAGVVAALEREGALSAAVAVALDGPYMDGEQLNAELQALLSALPEAEAAPAGAFLMKLVSGMRGYIEEQTARPSPGAALPPPEVGALQPRQNGAAALVREIADLFVPMDEGLDGETERFVEAASSQKASLQRLAAGVEAGGTAEAVGQMKRIAGHVRLVSDISQYAFQQIPVRLNGSERTVELYVKRGRGRGKINADNANILIALDTGHLGRLEAHIGVTNKSLRLRFGVETPELAGHVNAYSADLAEAMREIGYRLSDIRTEVTARPVTPLTVAAALDGGPAQPGALDIKL